MDWQKLLDSVTGKKKEEEEEEVPEALAKLVESLDDKDKAQLLRALGVKEDDDEGNEEEEEESEDDEEEEEPKDKVKGKAKGSKGDKEGEEEQTFTKEQVDALVKEATKGKVKSKSRIRGSRSNTPTVTEKDILNMDPNDPEARKKFMELHKKGVVETVAKGA